MKTALQVVVVFTFFFTVGRLVAEQLPADKVEQFVAAPVEQLVAVTLPNIGQKDKRFSVDRLNVKVGDTVKFTNDYLQGCFHFLAISTKQVRRTIPVRR